MKSATAKALEPDAIVHAPTMKSATAKALEPDAIVHAPTNLPGVKNVKKSPYFEVERAWLHQAVVWPGGALNAQTTLSKEKCSELKMHLMPQGLLVTAKGKQILVPIPNVVSCVLKEIVEV